MLTKEQSQKQPIRLDQRINKTLPLCGGSWLIVIHASRTIEKLPSKQRMTSSKETPKGTRTMYFSKERLCFPTPLQKAAIFLSTACWFASLTIFSLFNATFASSTTKRYTMAQTAKPIQQGV
ncbi:MAG: hypothetical protein AAGJ35_12810 [Myxococcota bacterium]